MKVLVAMSGGVDSSVAASLLRDAGHDVTAVTMKLWGGASDTGCCSASDVDDARRVADALGIDHHTFAFSDDFETHVVAPYVEAHARGRTPNPCVSCNRHLKFDRLLARADLLGFDAIATGHHARAVTDELGIRHVARGADRAKDQSYVLAGLDHDRLGRVLFPVGHLTKAAVRSEAARLGLRTAGKPDSQDVCFITRTAGRERFVGDRLTLTPGAVVDPDGRPLGRVDAVELVTIGQRRGLGVPGGSEPRFAVAVDPVTATVVAGTADDLLVSTQPITDVGRAAGTTAADGVTIQVSAHGATALGRMVASPDGTARVEWDEPHRRVAPGQLVVAYRADLVVVWATAA